MPITDKKNADAVSHINELEQGLRCLRDFLLFAAPSLKLPACLKGRPEAEETASVLTELRNAVLKASKGDFSFKVTGKGFMPDTLRALQSTLNRLSLLACRASDGNTTEQQMDFMGDYADTFNSMVARLSSTLGKLREEEERWQMAMLCSRDGVWEVYFDSRTPPYYSPRVFEMLGIDPENAPGVAGWPKLFHPEDHSLFALYQRFALWDEPPHSFELDHKLRCADGTYRWFMTHGMMLTDSENGKPSRVIGVMTDIQDRKEREELFSHRATHDVLTDLPNRLLFDQHLDHAIAVARRAGSYVAVVMADLDKFKVINDTLGHHVGDHVLLEMADRMQCSMRKSDMVSRFGGDEFAMILAFAKDEWYAINKVLERTMFAMKKPVIAGGRELFITASLGVSVYPDHGELPKVLMNRADEAMYYAKALGRNACAFWRNDGSFSLLKAEEE